MEIFLRLMIFIMGTFFGSFFTLAVYRIPLKKDITHERSFCPNCNHRLNALDLVPVFSYLFLGGKCRYCGEKIRIRYLLLEVLSGLVFVIAFLSLNINIFNLTRMINFVFFVLMYVTLVLIAGIDKEYKKINFSVLVFGGICQAVYILYLYMIEDASMYRYSIYLLIFILVFVVNFISQKRKENYPLQILTLFTYILAISGLKATLMIGILGYMIFLIINFKKEKKMPLGFIICLSTICYEIVQNFTEFY